MSFENVSRRADELRSKITTPLVISQIVALSVNNIIGKDNKLLWQLPEDMKFFKEQTQGKILIMGRKTYESIGRPLPNRYTIVITRQQKVSEHPNLRFVQSYDQALEIAQELVIKDKWNREIMIAGGGEIYKRSIDDVDMIYATRVNKVYEGDTHYSEALFNHFHKYDEAQSNRHEDVKYELWVR